MPRHPKGLRLNAITCALLALGWTHALATPAGLVEFAVGRVMAVGGDGRDRELAKGSSVESGDRVLTYDGRAQIRFTDGAFVSLAPNTDYLIKSYRYDGRPDGTEQGVFMLVKGAMRTVSGMVGRVNKSAYRLETPTATIGIRGTGGVIAILGDGGTLLTGTSGVWLLSNPQGTIEVRTGSTGYAGPAGDRAPETIAQSAVLPVPGIGERPTLVAGTISEAPYAAGDSVRPSGVPTGVDAVIPGPLALARPITGAGDSSSRSVPLPWSTGPSGDASPSFATAAVARATEGSPAPQRNGASSPTGSGGALSGGNGSSTSGNAGGSASGVGGEASGTGGSGGSSPSGNVPPGSSNTPPSPPTGQTGSVPGSVTPSPAASSFGGVGYAYADPRSDTRSMMGNDGGSRSGSAASASGSYELRSFNTPAARINSANGRVVDNAGATDTIGWGRWIGHAALGGDGGAIRFGENGGLHYFTGAPTALNDMPRGQAIYNFAGATRPTLGNEQIAPGLLENGRMVVDFDRARVGVQFDVRFPAANARYVVSTSGGLADVGTSQVQIRNATFGGQGALARNAADCAAGCWTQISGGFVGPQAAGAGFAYQIRDVRTPATNGTPGELTTINGAAAFVK